MLREGWAAVYKEAGRVYGKEGEAEYLRVEKEARSVSFTCLVRIVSWR